MPKPKVVKDIQKEAKGVHEKILKRGKPGLKFPIRSLANVAYRPAKGYFQLRGKKKERTLTVGTVKTFAQTLRMMSFSKELVETDDIGARLQRANGRVSPDPDPCRFPDHAGTCGKAASQGVFRLSG